MLVAIRSIRLAAVGNNRSAQDGDVAYTTEVGCRMRKRGIIGTLLLLVYLAGVGLFTGPSLAQLLVGHLPQQGWS